MVNYIFLIIYILFAGSLSGTDLYYLLSIHCLIAMIAHLQKKDNKITPIFLFYVGVIMVNYADIVLIGKINTESIKMYNYIVPKYIDEAVQLWCISTTLMIIGYNLAGKRSLPSIAFEIKKPKVLENIFYALLASNVMTIMGNRISFLPGPAMKIFALLNLIGIMFYARLWAINDDKKYRMYAITLWILETYVAIYTAFLRVELILPTVCIYAGYFLGKGKMKYVLSYRVVPFLLIISLYASIFKTLQANRTNFAAVIFESDYNGSEVKDKSKENSGALLERSANLAQMTCIIKLVKQNGFYNGKASEPLAAAVIPRFLWPDKPLIQLGGWFAYEISGGQKAAAEKATNSINMTVPGELYLDFGWWGVAIGSLLFGAFFPLLWNSASFYSSEYNISGTLIGGYLFILAQSGLGGDLQIVISLLSLYFSFWVLKKFLAGKL